MRLHFYDGFWQRKRLHFLVCGVAGPCRLLYQGQPNMRVSLRPQLNSAPFSAPFPTPAEWLHLPFSGNDFTYGFRTQNPDAKHVSCYVAARYDYTHPDYDFIVGIRRRKSDVWQGACHPEAPREGHGPVVAWQTGPR